VEKKPETKDGGWRGDLKKFGKHLLWIIPIVLTGFTTTLVVNNKGAKDSIESVSPMFIDFVRKNVGFGEEDLEAAEIDRIMKETIASALDVTVTLKSRDGSGQVDTMRFTDLKGMLLISEVMDMVKKEKEGGGVDWESFLKSVDVSFEFSDPKISESARALEDAQLEANPYSAYSLLRRERADIINSLPASESAATSVQMYSGSVWTQERVPAADDILRKQRSLISSSSSSSEGGTAVNAVASYNSNSSPTLIDGCKAAMYAPFYNNVGYIHRGLAAFEAYTGNKGGANNSGHDEGAGAVKALVSHFHSRGKYLESMESQKKSRSTQSVHLDRERMNASDRIEELRARLQRLDNDLSVGMRPYDDIMDERRTTTAEITRLQRKHINRFYFF
jgi:hypothetical protein